MKTLFRFSSVLVLLVVMACGASKSSEYNKLAAQQIAEKNNQNIPLIDRIRRLSGITMRNGIPYFMKAANQVSGTATEPLYILNGYTVGNSFYSVNQLVESVNIKKIEALTGSDAAEYGSRGASGVIKITTYQ
jgi:Uncharacterized Fe-S oxidoreductase